VTSYTSSSPFITNYDIQVVLLFNRFRGVQWPQSNRFSGVNDTDKMVIDQAEIRILSIFSAITKPFAIRL
jgi:hypothetical protein